MGHLDGAHTLDGTTTFDRGVRRGPWRARGDIAQLRNEVTALRRDDANVKAQLGAIQAGLAALQAARPLIQSKGARLRRLARV